MYCVCRAVLTSIYIARLVNHTIDRLMLYSRYGNPPVAEACYRPPHIDTLCAELRQSDGPVTKTLWIKYKNVQMLVNDIDAARKRETARSPNSMHLLVVFGLNFTKGSSNMTSSVSS